MMARYNVTVPPTAEQGSYKTIARDTNGQTFRADALQDYNSCRAHDGLPPISRMPRGTVYAPITYGTGYEGVTLHLDSAGSLDDAQRWGEHEAEKQAEEGRKEDAKFQAEQQIEQARESIHSLNVKALSLIRAIKQSAPFQPAICEALRENLRGYLATRTGQFKRIATLQDDYWQAVQ